MDPQTWGAGSGLWFVLALVNAGLAEQKNRSRLRWFVVSLVLGPLATALIVVWPPVEGDWRDDPVVTLNIVRDVRDRWILALGLALLGAFFVLLAGLFTEQVALSLTAAGCLVMSTLAVSWLLLAKKQREQSGKQAPD